MLKLTDFVGPVKTPAMRVEVISRDGEVMKTFDAPVGFQLERYVDSLYPNEEFMCYETGKEINISVLGRRDILEIYKGTYK